MTSGDLDQISGHYGSGRWFIARAACWKVIENHASDRELIRQVALIALQSGDPTTAIDVLSRAVELRPEDGEFHNILGNAHRQLGALDSAVSCFQRAAEASPGSVEALNNLGVSLLEMGKPDAARECFQKVLELNGCLPAIHYNLGNLQQIHGQLADAVGCYQRAISDRPDYVEAHVNLGAAFLQLRRYEESIWHLRRALELRPNNPEALNNLGAVHYERKELALAVDCFQAALKWDPNYWEARGNLGDALNDQGQPALAAEAYAIVLQSHPELHDIRNKLGMAWQRCGRFVEAAACYQGLADELPGLPAPLNNLGVALQLQGRSVEAVACFERVLTLSATNSEGLINLATVLRENGQWVRSIELYERALKVGANLPRVHLGMGDVFCDQRRLQEARQHYDVACNLVPQDADVRFHRAMGLLRMGDFAKGWKEFEWRWKASQFRPQQTRIPAWCGERLEGLTILVQAEQGLGDTLQFVRYLHNVKQMGAEVVFACPDELVHLLRPVAGAGRILPLSSTLPSCDRFVPLMSLPAIFGTTLDTVPADVPYLSADPALVECWQERLKAYRGAKIGVCWRGNPQNLRDRWRSIPRSFFDELSQVSDAHFFSLQKDSHLPAPPF